MPKLCTFTENESIREFFWISKVIFEFIGVLLLEWYFINSNKLYHGSRGDLEMEF
jgi:hypothetical protein